MSQSPVNPLPPPVPPPAQIPGPVLPYSYPPVTRRIAIARRAGWLMIALGVVILLGGGCFSLIGAMLPSMMGQLPPETAESLRQVQTQTHVPPQKLMLIMAGVLVAIGIFQIVMGVLVRRGGRGSIRTATIATATLTTIWTINLFAGLASGNAANVAGGAGILLISICLLGWQLSWLFQALHATRNTTDSPARPNVPMVFAGQFQYPPLPPEPSPIGWAYPPPPPPHLNSSNAPTEN